MVSQVDWLASLASLTGAAMPKGTAPDSYNFLGSWLGKEKKDRPWVIEQASNHTLSVRTKDWKYIEPNGGPKMIQWGPKIETGNSKEPQLYKMEEVKEVTNYASQMPEKVAELQTILQGVRYGKRRNALHTSVCRQPGQRTFQSFIYDRTTYRSL